MQQISCQHDNRHVKLFCAPSWIASVDVHFLGFLVCRVFIGKITEVFEIASILEPNIPL